MAGAIEQNDLVTLDQAAAALGIDRGSVSRAIRQGRLPAVRFGERALAVRARDVRAYKAASRPPGRPRRGTTDTPA